MELSLSVLLAPNTPDANKHEGANKIDGTIRKKTLHRAMMKRLFCVLSRSACCLSRSMGRLSSSLGGLSLSVASMSRLGLFIQFNELVIRK